MKTQTKIVEEDKINILLNDIEKSHSDSHRMFRAVKQLKIIVIYKNL